MIASLLAVAGASPSAAASVTVVRGWVLAADGSVTSIGGAPSYGNIAGHSDAQPAAIVATPSGKGFYIVERHGRVNTFGDARWRGDVRNLTLDRPIVDATVSPTNGGYALLASDGGVFNFGDLPYHGSVPQFVPLAAQTTTAVAIMGAPDGRGYWVVHDDGGVFAFGSAPFHGSVPQYVPPGQLATPVVDAFEPSGSNGYWMMGGDGGVFAFGAAFLGSRAGAGSFVAGTDVPGSGHALLDSAGGVHWMTPNGFSAPAFASGSAWTSVGAVDIAAIGTGVVAQSTTPPPTTSPPTTSPPPPTTTPPPTTNPPPTTSPPTTAPPPSGPVAIFSNHTANAGPDSYFLPPIPAVPNWSSIVNGRAIWNLNITAKPTSKPVLVQVCMWHIYDPFWTSFDETCSPLTQLTDETSLTIDLGVPANWWKLNGTFPWHLGPNVIRIMIKDASNDRLMMQSQCGAFCYIGDDLTDHVPITVNATLTFNN